MSDLLNYIVDPDENYDDDDDEDSESDEEEEEPGIDDTLPPLERIKKYSVHYLMLNRLHITRDLRELCDEITMEEALEHLPEAIQTLGEDSEAIVRQTLVEQLVSISEYFMKNEKGYQIVVSQYIPILTTLLADINVQVRVSCSNALYGVSGLIEVGQREQLLVQLLKQLTAPGNEEEHRVEAILLQNRLAPYIGKHLCFSELLPLLCEMHKDASFRIRKALAASLEGIIQLLDQDTVTDRVLPMFLELTEDEMWGVRKACAESISVLSAAIRPQQRPLSLIPVFTRFSQDQSRWVRSATFQNLGPFIVTFTPDTVDESLIKLFLSMITSGDSDLLHYAAFNFPGVIQTCSTKHWHLISEPYLSLCQDLQWKVRASLAHSLHEVGRILGRSITETVLLPVFDLFLKDLDEVKTGVVKHMSEFLAITSADIRQSYIPTLTEIITEHSNWRFRKLVSKQLGAIFRLYPLDICSKQLIPLAMHLLRDPVSSVRKAAESQAGKIISHLASDGESHKTFIKEIQELAKNNYFVDRQTFVKVSHHLMTEVEHELFCDSFIRFMLDSLTSDRVVVVRVLVSEFFVHLLATSTINTLPETMSSEVRRCCQTLMNDPSRDVRYPFETAPPAILQMVDPSAGSSKTPSSGTPRKHRTPSLVATPPDSGAPTVLIPHQAAQS